LADSRGKKKKEKDSRLKRRIKDPKASSTGMTCEKTQNRQALKKHQGRTCQSAGDCKWFAIRRRTATSKKKKFPVLAQWRKGTEKKVPIEKGNSANSPKKETCNPTFGKEQRGGGRR